MEVKMLPQRRGLGGCADKDNGSIKVTAGRVKKSRGGEKSRRKKHAERARQSKEAEKDKDNRAEIQEGPGAVGLFSFINNQLGEERSYRDQSAMLSLSMNISLL